MTVESSHVSPLFDLLSVISTDPSRAALASKQLQEIYGSEKPVSLVSSFLSICLNTGVDESLLGPKQLAAVELRKLVDTHYDSFTPDLKSLLKSNLLSFLQSTPPMQHLPSSHSLFYHSLARVLSEVAKQDAASNGSWPELIPAVMTMSQNPTSRQMGVYLVYTLFDAMIDQMDAHLFGLFTTLSKILVSEGEPLSTLVLCVQSLGRMADFIDATDANAVKTFQEIIPVFVRTLSACLSSKDDSGALKIFEVFDNLLMLEVPFLNPHFTELVQFYVQVAQTDSYSDQSRVMALSFIMFTTLYKKTLLQKKHLISPILIALMQVGTEAEPADRDQDYPSKVAFQVLNSFATTFPSNRVFPDVLQLSVQYLQSANPGERKASMMALAVLVEGCADRMREQSHQLIQMIEHALKDSDPVVKRAACIALGIMAEELDTEFRQHHGTFLPILFKSLDEPSCQGIVTDILNALDVLLESLDSDINMYIEPLMAKLLVLLETSAERKVQITAMNCIGSIAHSAEEGFMPYFEQVLKRILYLMSIHDNNDLIELRSVATDAAGTIANAVGKAAFAPYMEQTMQLAVAGLELNESRLLECSYTLFGVLARTFGADFSPFLPLILPRIMQSCQTQEKDWNDFVNTANAKNEEDLEDISEDDDDEGVFSMAAAHEKQSSLDALGELFEATKSAFVPYAQDAIQVVLSQFGHYYEGVRTSAVECALKFYTALYEISTGSAEWEAGLPLKKSLDPQLAEFGRMIIESIISFLDEEEDRMVVAKTFNVLSEALKTTGPSLVSFSSTDGSSQLDAISNFTLQVLKCEHVCQEQNRDEDGKDDEDIAELDGVVIGAAGDLVAALSAALTHTFIPYFQTFVPALSKYYKPSRSVSERSMAIGALAECAQGMESAIESSTEALYKLFMKALGDEEEEVQSNAAFGIGVLIANSPLDMSSQFPAVLQTLHSLFEPGTGVTNRVDNACGAVSRMILRSPQAVPLEHVYPVILSHLPLTKDYEENTPIVRAILSSLRENQPSLMQELPRLFTFFATVLGPPEAQLKDDVRKEVIGFLNQLRTSHPDQFTSLAGGLNPNAQQVLASALSQ